MQYNIPGKILLIWSERVRDCCLMPSEHLFSSYIMVTAWLDDSHFHFVQDRLSWILVLVHWYNSSPVDMTVHSITLPWFWANKSLFRRGLLLIPSDLQGSSEYQIDSLWFNLTRVQNHDLPHQRRTRKPLHHALM